MSWYSKKILVEIGSIWKWNSLCLDWVCLVINNIAWICLLPY